MQLSYDGIFFDVLLLKDWLKEAVFTEDKSTFLYWHHVIEVEVIVNDQATSAEFFPKLKDNEALAKELGKNKEAVGKFRLDKRGNKIWQIGVIKGAPKDYVGPLVAPVFVPRGDVVLTPEQTTLMQKLGLRDNFKPEEVIVPGVNKATVWNQPDDDGFAGEAKDIPKNPEVAAVDKPLAFKQPKLNNRKAVVNQTTHTIPTTDNELRQRLARPRRQLDVWMYTGKNGKAEYILRSPQPTAVVDAFVGPVCTIMNTTAIHGQMTEVLTLRFETWEGSPIIYGDVANPTVLKGVKNANNILAANAAGPNGPNGGKKTVTTPPVLSHRWSMSFGWDSATHLRTQNIEGEVIFRADVLHIRKVTADQLRPYFLAHQIPTGFVRQPDAAGNIQLNSEGTGVKYKVVDVQQMSNFPGGATWGLIQLECSTNYVYSTIPPWTEVAKGMWDRITDKVGITKATSRE